MLNIFNDLEPFLRDNYRRANVREYARIMKITPPTASKMLSMLEKEGLLKREDERRYIYYAANRESKLLIHLSRIYWLLQLEKSGLIGYVESELISPAILLFGSFSKAEVKEGSDIDLAIFSVSGRKISFEQFEKNLGRKVHPFIFKVRNDVKNQELLNNILNGFIVSGGW